MSAAIDDILVAKCHLVKSSDGFYLGAGHSTDLAYITKAIGILKRSLWFLDNVRTWLLFDSTDSDDPTDFAVDDVKEFYRKKFALGA